MIVIMDVTFPLCKSHFQERTQLILYYYLAHIRLFYRALFSCLSTSFLLFLMADRTFEDYQHAGRKGRGLRRPVAAGDKENKVFSRRVEEGSRNSLQQLEQNVKSEWDLGHGGPNVPQTVGMLFSLILPICDFAAAEPWKSAKDCLEGAALFHRRTDNLLLTLWGGGKKKKRQGC